MRYVGRHFWPTEEKRLWCTFGYSNGRVYFRSNSRHTLRLPLTTTAANRKICFLSFLSILAFAWRILDVNCGSHCTWLSSTNIQGCLLLRTRINHQSSTTLQPSTLDRKKPTCCRFAPGSSYVSPIAISIFGKAWISLTIPYEVGISRKSSDVQILL